MNILWIKWKYPDVFVFGNPSLKEDIDEKKVFFRALPDSPKPQLGPLFFWRQKSRLGGLTKREFLKKCWMW